MAGGRTDFVGYGSLPPPLAVRDRRSPRLRSAAPLIAVVAAMAMAALISSVFMTNAGVVEFRASALLVAPAGSRRTSKLAEKGEVRDAPKVSFHIPSFVP